MKHYKLSGIVSYIRDYEVLAESPEDAIERVENGIDTSDDQEVVKMSSIEHENQEFSSIKIVKSTIKEV
jgi:acylphosphatase